MAYLERRTPDGQRKTVSYRIRWQDEGGSSRSRSFARKSDAEAFMRRLDDAQDRGAVYDPDAGKETLAAYGSIWLGELVTKTPKTREASGAQWNRRIRPAMGDMPLRAIKASTVRAFVAALAAQGLSPSQVRQAFYVLSGILERALDDGQIASNPCRDRSVRNLLPRQPEKDVRIPSPEEVARIADAMPSPRDRALVLTLAYCGLRWGEAAGLRRGRVDLLRGEIRVAETVSEAGGTVHQRQPTKTKRTRSVPIPKFLREPLARALESVPHDPEAFVFGAKGGTAPMRASNFRRRVWLPAVEAAKVGEYVEGDGGRPTFRPSLTPHDLRHYCASVLLRHGVSVKLVSEVLGHSTPMLTLSVYGHVFESERARVADVLDQAFGNEFSPRAPHEPVSEAPGRAV